METAVSGNATNESGGTETNQNKKLKELKNKVYVHDNDCENAF